LRRSLTYTVVVPLSVLSNWESQIKQHCTSGSLSYYTYYGSGRNASTHELKKYDVVITTYQVVTKEFTDGVEPILQEEALAKLGLSNGGGASKQKKQKKSLPTMFAMRWKV
jgi:SWI/SNF-related matrix-associated actin-dependent regulator of chromatin subfamily A3